MIDRRIQYSMWWFVIAVISTSLLSGCVKNQIHSTAHHAAISLKNDDLETYGQLYDVIKWFLDLGMIKRDALQLNTLLKDWILTDNNDNAEYISLSKILAQVEPQGGVLTNQFKQRYIEFISENITKDAIEADILPDIYGNDDGKDGEDEEVEEWFNEIVTFVEERISEVAIRFSSSEIEKISDHCNVDEIIRANRNALLADEQRIESFGEDRYGVLSTKDAIDDLFDRG